MKTPQTLTPERGRVVVVSYRTEKGGPDRRGRPSYRWTTRYGVADPDTLRIVCALDAPRPSSAAKRAREMGYTVDGYRPAAETPAGRWR